MIMVLIEATLEVGTIVVEAILGAVLDVTTEVDAVPLRERKH